MVERLRERGLFVRVALAFLTIYLVWGSTFLGIRIAIDSIPPVLMCALRLGFAGVLMVLWARLRGGAWPRGREWGNAAVVGVMLPAFGNGGVTLGETRVPTGLVALLVGSIPLWMALLAWLGPHGVRPAPAVLLGLAIGFAGIGLLLGPGAFGARGANTFGWAVIPVAGSLSWAWGSLFSRRARLPASAFMGTGIGLLAGSLLLFAVSAALGEYAHFDPSRVATRSLLALAYLSIVGTVLGFSAYLFLLRTVSPTLVSTYAFVNPIIAMVIGGVFAGEHLTRRALVAAVCVVASVVLITLSRLRAPAGASTTRSPAPEREGAKLPA